MIRRCEVELVLNAIRRSGVGDDVEGLLVPNGTGRPRELKAEVFFAGAVLVAYKGLTLTLTNVHRALTEWIPISVQNALGTRIKTSPDVQSEPMVRYLLSAIEHRLAYTAEAIPDLSNTEREFRSEALQSVVDRLLRASLLQSMPTQLSLAWDSSGVESWGKPKWRATATSDGADLDVDDPSNPDALAIVRSSEKKATSKGTRKKKDKPEVYSFDPDAHLGYRTKTYDNKSNKLFGYDLFAGVAVLPVGAMADLLPKLVLSLTLRPAAGSVTEPTLLMLDRLIQEGHVIDEILVDRGFSYKIPEDWANELRNRGISQVQDIHPNDRGVRDFEGIKIIGGIPYCDQMPERLINPVPPARFKVGPLKKKATKEERENRERNLNELAEFSVLMAERELYAYEFHENNPTIQDPGNTRWKCPGEVGKLKCAHCPISMDYSDETPVIANPPAWATAPKGCRQQTVSIPGPALAKLRQKDYWGSPAWIASFSRRSHIEGIFGNLRNPSTQNIKRGFCRVVGLVKTSLMITFQAMAANIRLIRQWSRRTGDVTDPLSEPMPENFGFEELDEHGQISLTEPFDFDDPPDELVA